MQKTRRYDAGYRRENTPDALFPGEFGERGAHIHHYAELDSTMNMARSLARDNCPAFSVVIAERQTRGRGRLDRRWLSDEGGLYFTVVLRPTISPLLSARINLYTCLVLIDTLREHLGISAAIKWPNDILVQNRKLAGMLAEMETAENTVKFVNIGLGVNVNNDPTAREPRAVSLKQILGRSIPRRPLLEDFLDRLESGFGRAGSEAVIERWKACSVTLNRQVKIVARDRVVQGLAMDMDPGGALMVRQDDGSTVTVTHGDCFHRDDRPA
jgi:BirA family biotin operon repressor/biotin-[acetyl-CoA-carboxylase] ligase